MKSLKLHLMVRFNRSFEDLSEEEIDITPGGFFVETREPDGSLREWEFDFNCSGLSKTAMPDVLQFDLDTLDVASFPDSVELIEHLDRIVKIKECFIYTWERGEFGMPLELLDFVFFVDGENGSHSLGVVNGEYTFAIYDGVYASVSATTKLLKEAEVTNGTLYEKEYVIFDHIYRTFCDDNPRHCGEAFESNGCLSMNLAEMHQFNLDFVKELLERFSAEKIIEGVPELATYIEEVQ